MVSERCQTFSKMSDSLRKVPDGHIMVNRRCHIFFEEGLGNMSDVLGNVSNGLKRREMVWRSYHIV